MNRNSHLNITRITAAPAAADDDDSEFHSKLFHKFMMLTQPVAVEIDGQEGRWNGEIVNQGKDLDQERQLIRSCYKLRKKQHTKR